MGQEDPEDPDVQGEHEDVVGVDMLHAPTRVGGGLVVGAQDLARLVAYGPSCPLALGGLAPVVSRTADLHRYPPGELGGGYDCLTLLVDLGLGQGDMPRTITVTGFAAGAALRKGLGLQVDAGGMATIALLQPRPLVPVGLVVQVLRTPEPTYCLGWLRTALTSGVRSALGA
jgi:hypothetical protein